jgi:hypothetical protein
VTRRLGNRRAYRGVSWADHALTWARTAHPTAFNAVVGPVSRRVPSAMGTWQGRPWSRHLGSTWRHRTPPVGKRGVRTPEASWRDRPIGVWLPHVAHRNPLGCPSLWRPYPSTLPSWARGGRRTYKSSGGRSGDHGPSWQVRTIRPVSQRTRVWAWKILCPLGWTVCQMTSRRSRPAERQISS